MTPSTKESDGAREQHARSNRDPTWDEKSDEWQTKTLSYYTETIQNRHARTSLTVDELDDDSRRMLCRWTPLTGGISGPENGGAVNKEYAATIMKGIHPGRAWRAAHMEEHENMEKINEDRNSRQALRAKNLREVKAFRSELRALARNESPWKAKTIAIQTEEVTAAERAAIARKMRRPEAIPLTQASDDEIATFCTKHKVRLAIPAGICDDANTYPSPWVVECMIRTGARKGTSTQAIGIDTVFVGYTGDPKHIKREDDPLRRDALCRQYFHVSRQPSTDVHEITIRELIAKTRPEAETLHDLMQNNYENFEDIVKLHKEARLKPKNGKGRRRAKGARPTDEMEIPQQELETRRGSVEDYTTGLRTDDAETAGSEVPRTDDAETEEHRKDNAATASTRTGTEAPETTMQERAQDAEADSEPQGSTHSDEKWRLKDGQLAHDLIGREVAKEFKRKGGKISRGVFHGMIDKVSWEPHLKDPIVFWCLFKEDGMHVRYNQGDIAKIMIATTTEAGTETELDDDQMLCTEAETSEGHEENTTDRCESTMSSEGQGAPATREMSVQTDDLLKPNAAWFTKESTRWGETVEVKYRDDAELEHTRFGHPGIAKMEALQKCRKDNEDKDLGIRWLNAAEEITSGKTCTCCLANKGMVRRKISSKHRRRKATRYLERVHVDESGRLAVPSYGGAQYYTVFVDEYTRWKWTYVHARKTDIFEILQRFLLDAQDDDNKVGAIRFDQSSDHMAEDYRTYLTKHNIKMEAPCTESHYQNGIAEKAVRDVADMARCMLNAENYRLPRDLWGWAVRYATHTQNRLPSTALFHNEKRRLVSPHYMRYGQDPDLSDIKPFGCEAFVHRDRASRFVKDSKLDEHGIQGMFVGRAEDGGELNASGVAIKGNIIWTLEGGPRVIISDQTTIIETRFPQLLGPVEWETTIGAGRKVSAEFAHEFNAKGVDGTPFYVTKAEAKKIGGGERLLDARVKRLSDGALGIIAKKDERAGLYKVYFLKNPKHWEERRKIGVDANYVAMYLPERSLNDTKEYEKGDYDGAWRRGIVFKEQEEAKQKYANMSTEEKAVEKARKLALKDATVQKLKSNEAPISSRIYEPKTYRQAMACEDRELWLDSIKKEIEGLMTLGVLQVVQRAPRTRAIDSKFVFKVKYNPDGSVDKYKSRMVLRGDRQVAGRDYDVNKIFAPVANQTLARTMISLAASLDLEMDMADVKQAYLNAELAEKHLVVEPAPGITEVLGVPKGSWLRVCRSQYGLRQSGYNWFREFGGWIRRNGFSRCSEDDCLFAREREVNGQNELIMILQYVDDLLIFSNSRGALDRFKAELEGRYAIEDKGPAAYYLGVEIERDRDKKTISIHQGKYIRDMIEGIEATRKIKEHDTPMAPGKRLMANEGLKIDQLFYQSCIGTLLYLSGWTRPDISYTVSELSKHVINPGVEHHDALMYLVGYVKRTMNMKITYGREPREGIDFGINELGGYVDASFAGDHDTRKSKTGFVMFLNGGPVSWKAKDQSIVALSTTDSEIDAAVRAIREVKGIRAQLFDLNLEQQRPTILYEDNAATICISHSASLRDATKHLGYRRSFLRDEVEKKEVVLLPIATSLQTADIFTKGLSRVLNERHCTQLFAEYTF